MKKAEVMDQQLREYGNQVTSGELFEIVKEVFGFDLDIVPLLVAEQGTSREVVDRYLEELGGNKSGFQIRQLINQLFGVNLEALSALEGEGISVYAKRRWVIAEPSDCFVVYSGDGDRIARVFTTPAYEQKTGCCTVPEVLAQGLIQMGYVANYNNTSFYYENETDTAVPDVFKGQTIGTLLQHMPPCKVYN